MGLEHVVTAPCRSHDPEWWFSSAREELSRAMSLCRSCSHMSECLAGALARGEAAGVWGGRYLVEGGSLLCQVHGFPFAGGSGCPLPGAEMTRKVHRVWSRQRTVWPPRATGAAELFGCFQLGDCRHVGGRAARAASRRKGSGSVDVAEHCDLRARRVESVKDLEQFPYLADGWYCRHSLLGERIENKRNSTVREATALGF